MAPDDYRWHYDYSRLARDSGFTFQIHRSKLSLDKNIGHIDIEQVIRDRDIAAIEKHIGTLVEFTLDNDQTSILDPSFVKIFRISQLAVQYLLFCKKYLDNTVVLIKKEFVKNNEETKNLKRYVDELRQEAANSKKQVKELKSALNCQIASAQNASVFQCNECPKAFSTEEYLLAHIKRRHEALANIGTSGTSFQAETDKLQLEIKQLKERLNNTEKFIHNDEPNKPKSEFIVMPSFAVKDNAVENTLLADLQQKFELLKAHVENELRILQTQKFDQDKYEKWFETFLNKLEQTHGAEVGAVNGSTGRNPGSGDVLKANQLELGKSPDLVCKNCQGKAENDEQKQIPKGVNSLTKAEVGRNDNTTQTDFAESSEQVCKDCQARSAYRTIDAQKRSSFGSNENIQQKLRLDTENRLDKFEEKLQEKFTGNIEVLQSQLQSFWSKMGEIEKQKLQTPESTPDKQPTERIDAKLHKMVPKPRKKVQVAKEAFKASPVGKPHQRVVQINPKPIEAIKSNNITFKKNPSIEIISLKEAGTNYVDSDSDDDTESQTSDESESSESESETDSRRSTVYAPRPSVTSTLGQRSLTSLKEAAFTPEVLQGLQKEVENILNNRLEEIGVSPNWSTLPLRSYQRAVGIVTHQAALIQKNIANYKHIRSQILKDVNKQVAERNKSMPQRNSKLKTLFSNVKNKTKVIINNEPKYTNKSPRIREPKPQQNKVQKPETLKDISNFKPSTRMYITESESDNSTKNRRSNAWNQSKITDQTQKAYYDVIQELNTTVNTKKQSSEVSSEANLSLQEPKPQIPLQKDDSEDDSPSDAKVEPHAKGVLKNYPSTGSLQKKKVLFDLKSSDTSPLKEPVKLAAKTNDGGSTTSIASSVLDGSKTNLLEQAPKKKQQDLSDVSDWDLSEILD